MLKVGHKIQKIRDLKNITAKDMADRLDMTTTGYQKIERDEVSINMDRLQQIAGIFEMKPEEVLTFDEKLVFNNSTFNDNASVYNHGTFHNTFPEEMKKLYEENIRLQAEQIKMQAEMIEMLKVRLKKDY